MFYSSGYRCLKHFYLEEICKHKRHQCLAAEGSLVAQHLAIEGIDTLSAELLFQQLSSRFLYQQVFAKVFCHNGIVDLIQ